MRDYEIDTAVATDPLLFSHGDHPRYERIILNNLGPNPVYIIPYRTRYPSQKVVLRKEKEISFANLKFTYQICFEKIGALDTVISVTVFDTEFSKKRRK